MEPLSVIAARETSFLGTLRERRLLPNHFSGVCHGLPVLISERIHESSRILPKDSCSSQSFIIRFRYIFSIHESLLTLLSTKARISARNKRHERVVCVLNRKPLPQKGLCIECRGNCCRRIAKFLFYRFYQFSMVLRLRSDYNCQHRKHRSAGTASEERKGLNGRRFPQEKRLLSLISCQPKRTDSDTVLLSQCDQLLNNHEYTKSPDHR